MKEKDSDELFMEELKKEFFEKTSKSLKRMLEYFEMNDFDQIRKIAHDIKGTAGVFEMNRGSELGHELQEAADEKNSILVKKKLMNSLFI